VGLGIGLYYASTNWSILLYATFTSALYLGSIIQWILMIINAEVVSKDPEPNEHAYQIAIWIRVLMFPVLVYEGLILMYDFTRSNTDYGDAFTLVMVRGNEILFVIFEMLSGNSATPGILLVNY
jgi:hypothetical protein